MKRLGPALLCAVLLSSCATPQAPSGGPPDTTPPEIAESTPIPGAVNVTGQTIRITFSEYVQEASLGRALSITPAPTTAPEVSWSGRSVEIRLPEALRPNTTYVVTLDTELRDIRGVALNSPIMLAFSSGATINAGKLTGRVVLPMAGDPAAGVDVFAYALTDSAAPDPLPERPDYRTQTDQSGAFAFDYMTEQYYFVVALRDQNRNLNPDPQEDFAPPPVPALFADTVSVVRDLPWVLTKIDTTRPSPLRIQSLAASRHAVRMSEPVRFISRDPSAWQLRDSTTGAAVDIRDLYIRQDDRREVLMQTPPLAPKTFTVQAASLADTSENAVLGETVSFTPSTAEDTVQHRFLGFLPANELGPTYELPRGVDPGLHFNAPVDEILLSTAVAVTDSNGAPLAFSAVTDDGTRYRLLPDSTLETGGRIEVRVDGAVLAGPDSVHTAVFQRITLSETGEVRGVVMSAIHPVIVQIFPVDVDVAVPRYDAIADSAGVFLFRGLPAGAYRLRAFGEHDEDGTWSGGMLQPYLAPEPIAWLTEPTRVRARWETSLPDTLRIRAPDRSFTP